MLKTINKKKKKGSNGMDFAMMILGYNYSNLKKYLNISVSSKSYCAGMAEWLTQSIDTRCPSGCVGSIPTPSAGYSKFLEVY